MGAETTDNLKVANTIMVIDKSCMGIGWANKKRLERKARKKGSDRDKLKKKKKK